MLTPMSNINPSPGVDCDPGDLGKLPPGGSVGQFATRSRLNEAAARTTKTETTRADKSALKHFMEPSRIPLQPEPF